jgi:hypothetical protein
MNVMFQELEIGAPIITDYGYWTVNGEVTSLHTDESGDELVTVMYEDGAVKVYRKEEIQ